MSRCKIDFYILVLQYAIKVSKERMTFFIKKHTFSSYSLSFWKWNFKNYDNYYMYKTHINKFQMLQICQEITHLAWLLRFHPHSNPFSQLKLFKIAGMSHWCLDIIIRNLTSNFSPGFQKMLSNSSPEPKIGVAYKKCVFIFIFDCLQVLNFLHSVFIGIFILRLV